MWTRALSDCKEIIAGDGTRLRELLHPDRNPPAVHYSLAHARLVPGNRSLRHRLQTSEVYYILSGEGEMEIDGEHRAVKTGDTVYIPPRAFQRITALGSHDLEFLCIVDPPWRSEDEELLEH